MSIMSWGHRGYQRHRFPEKYNNYAYQNTMPAFEYALTHTSGLETDVIQSKEGTIFLTHDTLFLDKVKYELKTHLDEKSRELLGERFIFDLSDEEAESLRLKDGEKLVKLDDLLAVMPNYPGRILNLELKGPKALDNLLKTIDRALEKGLVTEDQIVISSFNLPDLAALRKKRGDQFKIGVLLSMKTQTKSLLFPEWPNAPQDAFYTPFNPQEEVLKSDLVQKIKPDYFHLERNSVNKDDIILIGKYYPDALVSLWCVGESHPEDNDDYIKIIQELAKTGKIHAVMSDFPLAVQEECLKRGLDIVRPDNTQTFKKPLSLTL